MKHLFAPAVAAGLLAIATSASAAPVNGTGFLTSDVLYGSGNADGGFTGQTFGALELALRAHLRYPPSNVFNYDNVDTYTFGAGPGAGQGTNRSIFNFDFSVNTDVNDATNTPSATVDDYDFLLQVDNNPTNLTNFVTIDPFAVIPDNAFGYNSTSNGGGVESMTSSIYNVGQNSHNLGFGYSSDPDAEGKYTMVLSAFQKGTSNLIGSTSINVIVGDVPPVPVPAALPLLAGAIGGLALLRRRRRA